MEISVIGAGYVGLTTAACLAELGHQVRCTDNDTEKLNMLRAGHMPFFEPHLDEIVKKNFASGKLQYVSGEEAILRSQAIFICVGTPPLANGEADLSAIEAVARNIAHLAQGYRLVIEKSTVPVQTARRLKQHLGTYLSNDLDYDVVSNPEFLREGSAIEDFFHPDRIVVGADSRRAIALMKEIYQPIAEKSFRCPVHPECKHDATVSFLVTDTNSAELVKHASNSFLAMKISFINMVSDLCEAAGADIEKVAEGIGLDRRIGPAFLQPGIGFGGFCFPKDLQAFVRIAETFGCDFALLKDVENINHARVERFVAKVKKELWILRGKTIAVWGLAFKPNTDDIRFAPSLEIIRSLIASGARIRAYDPQAVERAKKEIPEIVACDSLYQAAEGAEAILLLTEWDEFLEADWARLATLVERPLVFDGRNCLNPPDVTAKGFQYFGVGTAPLAPNMADSGELATAASASAAD